jgi:ADP-ribose pyrophosphatase
MPVFPLPPPFLIKPEAPTDPVTGEDVPLPRPFIQVRRGWFRSDAGHFSYDWLERRALDAAIIVCYRRAKEIGQIEVLLRSSPRPPIAIAAQSMPERGAEAHVLWELPAGLIEPGESPDAGARRELFEETGIEALRLVPLFAPSYPCPAILAERHFFFAVEVLQTPQGAPPTDNSVLEQGAELMWISAESVLLACESSTFMDEKTELGVSRLLRYLKKEQTL